MPAEPELIAAVNAGSATLKFCLLEGGENVLRALIERLGASQGDGPCAAITDAHGDRLFEGSPAYSFTCWSRKNCRFRR